MKRLFGATLALALAACDSKTGSTAGNHRFELKRLSGATMQVVPAPNQLPYCLIYTLAEKDRTIRQMTMNRRNESILCEADKPVAKKTYRVPVEEGPVKVVVIFSDTKLNAGSIALQIYELSGKPDFNMLDLRAPGKVAGEAQHFAPEEELPTATGEVVNATTGEVADAGTLADGG